MDKGIEFITGEPALRIGKALVVSDLHIGIEYRYRKKGISLPSQSGRLMERLEKLMKKARTNRLVIIGDVKHKVPGTSFQEEREIPAFFRRLLESAEVDVVPGNHDGGIEKLLPHGVVMHPSAGFMIGKEWLCHGHAWPDRDFLEASRVVIGHNHAGIEFRDRLGYRWIEPVWVRTELDRKAIEGQYKSVGNQESLPEVIMMPPFNEFTGFIALNQTKSSREGTMGGNRPLSRASKMGNARMYMLDGTFLGELGKL